MKIDFKNVDQMLCKFLKEHRKEFLERIAIRKGIRKDETYKRIL